MLQRYPSVGGDGIRSYYARRHECDPETVFPANGASEALYVLFHALSPARVVLFTPSFHDYARAALLSGASLIQIRLVPEDDFGFPSVPDITNTLRNADAIIIGHPNNPTGTCMTRDAIRALSNQYPDTWIIVDESFSGFMPDVRTQSFLYVDDRPENMIVVQSLTKYYAVPGLRLGACIASPRIIRRLEAHGIPWRVNGPADALAPLLSNDDGYDRATTELIAAERIRMHDELSRCSGLTVFPSNANFFLAHWHSIITLDDFIPCMLQNGIVVRDCRNFPGLEQNYWRFVIRDSSDNTLFLELVKELAAR
jgi:threonine-phosphate decarboxylase